MKIEPGRCGRCSEIIYLAEAAGIRWTAEPQGLDAHGAVQALLDGRNLFRVVEHDGKPWRLSGVRPDTLVGLRKSDPADRPLIVAEHGCPCTAARALPRTPPGTPTPKPCPRLPQGRTQAFKGHARVDDCTGYSCGGCDPVPF